MPSRVNRMSGTITKYLERIMANHSAEEGVHGIAESLAKRHGALKFQGGGQQPLKNFLGSDRGAAAGGPLHEALDLMRYNKPTSGVFDFGTSQRRARIAARRGGAPGEGFISGAMNMALGTLGTGRIGQTAAAAADFYGGHGLAMGAKRGLATYAAIDVAGRVMGGNGLTRDKNGNFDIAGVPFF